MVSPAERKENFINFFCKPLSQKHVNIFDVDECRVRQRDRAAHMADGLFRDIVPLSREEAQPKFERLWEMRQVVWHDLTAQQRTECDANLRATSAELFLAKMEEQIDRGQCFDSYRFEQVSEGPQLLGRMREELVQYGRVGIDRHGNIVLADELDCNSGVLEFRYAPSAGNYHSGLLVLMPEKWHNITISGGPEPLFDFHGRQPEPLFDFHGRQIVAIRPGLNAFVPDGGRPIGIRAKMDSEKIMELPASLGAAPREPVASLPSFSASSSSSASSSLSPEQAERRDRFDSYRFAIEGVDEDRLKRELVQHGRVGIDRDGRIIEGRFLTDRDEVVEIRYAPESGSRPSEIVALIPDGIEWTMRNSEDTRYQAHRGRGKRLREFRVGKNEFIFERTKVFGMTMGSLPALSQASSSSSSSSSSSAASRAPVISNYDSDVNGDDTPVPFQFLITLKIGDRDEYFHCLTLIATILSQEEPLDPLSHQRVPEAVLDEMGKQIGVDPKEFKAIWSQAEKEYPKDYQYEARRDYRLHLFHDLLFSNAGTSSERAKRADARAAMDNADRPDWQILLRG